MPTDDEADYGQMWELVRVLVHRAGFELSDVRGCETMEGYHLALSACRQTICHQLKEAGYSSDTIADFLHVSSETVRTRQRYHKLRLLREARKDQAD